MSDTSETKDPFEGFVVETSVEEVDKAAHKADESVADTAADSSEAAPAEEDASAEKKEPISAKKAEKKTVEDRIRELTAKRRDAERATEAEKAAREQDRARIADLEARIAALSGTDTQKKPLTPAKDGVKSDTSAPNPDEFDYGEVDPRYVAALARYEAKQELAEQRRLDDETRQAEAAARKEQEYQQKLDTHLAKGVEKYADFEQAFEALESLPPIAREAAEMVMASEHAADILYHYGKNPAEAAEIASKPLIEQARILGMLEAKFSADKAAPKTEPKITSAAPPPSRVRGTDGRFTADDASDDFAAFEAKYVKPKG